MLRMRLQNIFETRSSNGATSENKTIHMPPFSLHSKMGCFLQVTLTVTQHCMEWGGGGNRKIPFSPLSLDRLNVQKVFLGQGVSLNFVADCKSVSDSSPVVFA